MYRDFYGFKDKPFSLLINPQFFYLSETHKRILDALKQAVDTRNFLCVLTGEIGVGKSALTRYFIDHLEDNYTAGLVNTTNLTADNFIARLLEAYNQPSSGSTEQLTKSFSQFVSAEKSKNNHPVLIIDDCHQLPVEVLNILHVIIQEFSIIGKEITTILVGEPALREKLFRKDLEYLSQHIDTNCELNPLSKDETAAYIHYQNEVAGVSPGLFDDGACKEIYEHTKGTPRSINLLCDSALVYGFLDEEKTITDKMIRQVISDKKEGKLLPNLLKAEEVSIKRAQHAEKIKVAEDARIKEEELRKSKEDEERLKTEKIQSNLKKQQEEQEAKRLKDEKEKKDKEKEAKIKADLEAAREKEKLDAIRHSAEKVSQPVKTSVESPTKAPIRKSAIGLVLVIAIASTGYVFLPEDVKTTLYESVVSRITAFENFNLKRKEDHVAIQKSAQKEQQRKTAELAAKRAKEKAREVALQLRKKEDARKKTAALKARLERERAAALALKTKREKVESERKKKVAQETARKNALEEAARKKAAEEQALKKYHEQELELEQKKQASIERAIALEAQQKEDANKERISEILQLDTVEPFE